MKKFESRTTNFNEKKMESGERIFLLQLNGVEGKEIEIHNKDFIVNNEKGVIVNNININSEKQEDRILNTKKDVSVSVGDYVVTKYNEKIYLITTDVDDHFVYNSCKMRQCDRRLIWKGNEKGTPCIMDTSSYGSKGIVNNITQFADFDSRGVILVQQNEITNKIYEGMRFIFNNSKYAIYQVTKRNEVFRNGYFQLVCKYTKAVREDDFENNIAWNKYSDKINQEENDKKINIQGNEKIVLNKTEDYFIENSKMEIKWSLDEDTINDNLAEIVYQDKEKCTVKALSEGEMIQLEARDLNGNLMAIFTMWTIRR